MEKNFCCFPYAGHVSDTTDRTHHKILYQHHRTVTKCSLSTETPEDVKMMSQRDVFVEPSCPLTPFYPSEKITGYKEIIKE